MHSTATPQKHCGEACLDVSHLKTYRGYAAVSRIYLTHQRKRFTHPRKRSTHQRKRSTHQRNRINPVAEARTQ